MPSPVRARPHNAGVVNQTNGNTSGVLLRVPRKSRWARLPFGVRMSIGGIAVLTPLVGAGLVTVAVVQGSSVPEVLGSPATTSAPASASASTPPAGTPRAVTGLGRQTQPVTSPAHPAAGTATGRGDGHRGAAAAGNTAGGAPTASGDRATPAPPRPRPAGPATGPTVSRHWTTQSRKIPFRTSVVGDPSLPRGTKQVRTRGQPGLLSLRYQVTTVDGRRTDLRLVSRTITRRPVTQVLVVGTREKPRRDCDPNYDGCVPVARDVDCRDGEGEDGDGPAWVGRSVRVLRQDIYGLDGDRNGYGCD